MDVSGQPFADLLCTVHAISLTYHASLTVLAPVHATSSHQLRSLPTTSSQLRPCILPTPTLRPRPVSSPRPSPAKLSHELSLPPPLRLSASLALVRGETQRTKPLTCRLNPFTTHTSQAFFSSSMASKAQLRDQRASPVPPRAIPTPSKLFQASSAPCRTFFSNSNERSGFKPANSDDVATGTPIPTLLV